MTPMLKSHLHYNLVLTLAIGDVAFVVVLLPWRGSDDNQKLISFYQWLGGGPAETTDGRGRPAGREEGDVHATELWIRRS